MTPAQLLESAITNILNSRGPDDCCANCKAQRLVRTVREVLAKYNIDLDQLVSK